MSLIHALNTNSQAQIVQIFPKCFKWTNWIPWKSIKLPEICSMNTLPSDSSHPWAKVRWTCFCVTGFQSGTNFNLVKHGSQTQGADQLQRNTSSWVFPMANHSSRNRCRMPNYPLSRLSSEALISLPLVLYSRRSFAFIYILAGIVLSKMPIFSSPIIPPSFSTPLLIYVLSPHLLFPSISFFSFLIMSYKCFSFSNKSI